jgi:23S rRNA (cytosine1962-C5)-methyltransferase
VTVLPRVTVSGKGIGRLRAGHPWIFRSDVEAEPGLPPGIVNLADARGRNLGSALWSPHSEIRARYLGPPGETVDASWWRRMIGNSLQRRSAIEDTAFRVVHAEGDGLPSLVVDRYGEYAVAQFLSAGLEAVRDDVVGALRDVLAPRGLLLRNDAPVRERERLPRQVELAFGEVPELAPYSAGGLTLYAAPWSGQKTGAFLDQRENQLLLGRLARGRCLDLFCHHGGFALHMARGGATAVTALDSSSEALAMLGRHAAANGLSVTAIEANAFDWLREHASAGDTWDVIVLDPPAFARDRRSVSRALAGYKELNLRALRMLSPGGRLFTASCSHHVHRGDFFAMLAEAAADVSRRIVLEEIRGASPDHPELLTVPETGYLKAALLRAAD